MLRCLAKILLSTTPRCGPQEEISLVGTSGKLEAFSPSHGTKTDDESEVCVVPRRESEHFSISRMPVHASLPARRLQINFRRGLRNPALFQGEWDLSEPPSPEECGSLQESHEAVSAELLEAGNHGAHALRSSKNCTRSLRHYLYDK